MVFSLDVTRLNHQPWNFSLCWRWHLFVLSPPGFQVVGGDNSGRSDPGTIISSITPGGPADVNGCLKPGRLLSLCSLFLLCGCENGGLCTFSCSFSDFPSPVQVTASFWWTTSTSRASLMPLRWTSCRTLLMMSSWWCHSPKRGSTKVKEASWLLFVSSFKNFSESLKQVYSLYGEGLPFVT